MTKLQEPAYVYIGGRLRPWAEATLHIGSEAVTRGLNVFEGLKGYWRDDGSFAIVELQRHYDRLLRSARLLHIPCPLSLADMKEAIDQLAESLLERSRDMWFRLTLYVVEGHWGEGTVADLVVTAYHQDKGVPSPVNLGVSTWRRSADVSLPARIKTSTNYQVARLARIEGRRQGCQDMILLNNSGRVAEATGSCVMMVRDGILHTPPPSEGALESITLEVIRSIAVSLGIPFVQRPIDRTELLVADEIGLCGTLAEIQIANSIDGVPLSGGARALQRLQSRFFSAVRTVGADGLIEMTPVRLPAVV